MQYPIELTFKILSLAPQIKVTDSTGGLICYVRQKLLALKEKVSVYRDEAQQQLLCEIRADRMIDFSACYSFYDAQGTKFGAIRRQGMKSLWKAHYEVLDESGTCYAPITEANPWVKVADALLSEIPLVGMFTGYLFNPVYTLIDPTGQELMKLTKRPAMLEGKFTLEKTAGFDPADELGAVMGFLMMTLLERGRG